MMKKESEVKERETNSNRAYMHSYYNTFVYMHNFTRIDMDDFSVKMCKINHFFAFYTIL